MKKYIVNEPFKDAAKYVKKGGEAKRYEVGDDVSKFKTDRLEDLVSRNLVRVEDDGNDEDPEPDETAGADEPADPKDKK
jgi:hypothetical protein